MRAKQYRKIGVLLPQSNAFPLMAKSFLNGLKLANSNENYDYIIESVGFGADEKQLLNSYQKLTFQHEVDLTTGLLGHNGLLELIDFASKNEEVLIIADMGAKKPIKAPRGVFQNSFGLYDSLGAIVRYLDSNEIKSIATSTCYYEAGYDFIEALNTTLNDTEHCSFGGHYITPLHPRENESAIMAQTFNAIQPDAIIAFHNAIYAKEHADFLQENNLHNDYPIYTLPFTYNHDSVKNRIEVFKKIKLISSWFPELENDVNRVFIASYHKKYGKTPDIFALLGYENGLVIHKALNNETNNLTSAIEQVQIDGPRGNIEFEAEFNRTNYKNYIWEILPDQEGNPTKRTIQNLDQSLNISSIDSSATQQTGWMNAYLCH